MANTYLKKAKLFKISDRFRRMKEIYQEAVSAIFIVIGRESGKFWKGTRTQEPI